MSNPKNDTSVSRQGLQASGSVSISERVAIGILSLLLSGLSFVGGYIYKTQKDIVIPLKLNQVEEVSLSPNQSTITPTHISRDKR